MRIAHFVHRYPPALGGAESYFARLSEHLAERGDDVTVFTTAALDLTAFWSPNGRCLSPGATMERGVKVIRYPLWRMHGRRWLLKPISLIPFRFWQCLTLPCNPISRKMYMDASRMKCSFDVVHASAFPYGFPIACGLRLARRLGVPFYLTPFLHLGDPDDPNDSTRKAYLSAPLLSLLEASDAVFVQTEGEDLALRSMGIPDQKIIVQGLGVDPDECNGGDRRRARDRWNIADNLPVIGHLANNSKEKGTVDLLRAAAMLWEKGQDFRIVLAGPEMPNFQRFWERFPQKEKVERTGVLSNQAKRDFFAGIDVFALPSRSDSFGLVLLEAWANSVANVAYRAGGVADVIDHQVDGLLAPCGDIAQLAESLHRLLDDDALRRRLAESGRRKALCSFAWEDKLQIVRSHYEKRVGRHPAKHLIASRET